MATTSKAPQPNAQSKDEWFAALEDFENWWLHVTEYANFEGNHELPRDFYKRNNKVCDFVENVAQRDVTPFHEIGALVKRHVGIICSDPDYPRDPDPHATISDIHNAIWRALPAKAQYINQLLASHKNPPAEARLTPNEERAKFCFEKWQAGQSYKEINTALKRNQEWDHFESAASVRGPIISWAKRIGSTPRQGQPGRPKQ